MLGLVGNRQTTGIMDEVLRRTIEVTLPVSENAYKKDDLVEWLAKVVPTGQVEALGAVRKNDLWHTVILCLLQIVFGQQYC